VRIIVVVLLRHNNLPHFGQGAGKKGHPTGTQRELKLQATSLSLFTTPIPPTINRSLVFILFCQATMVLRYPFSLFYQRIGTVCSTVIANNACLKAEKCPICYSASSHKTENDEDESGSENHNHLIFNKYTPKDLLYITRE
jgi:hypothetical protein